MALNQGAAVGAALVNALVERQSVEAGSVDAAGADASPTDAVTRVAGEFGAKHVEDVYAGIADVGVLIDEFTMLALAVAEEVDRNAASTAIWDEERWAAACLGVALGQSQTRLWGCTAAVAVRNKHSIATRSRTNVYHQLQCTHTQTHGNCLSPGRLSAILLTQQH